MVVTLDPGVVKSDAIVPEDVRERLRLAVGRLEKSEQHRKDWHPGTNEQVLDLVHPSLFPIIYGRTRILPKGFVDVEDPVASAGSGVLLPPPKYDVRNVRFEWAVNSISEQFQWLPCEVYLGEEQIPRYNPARPSEGVFTHGF